VSGLAPSDRAAEGVTEPLTTWYFRICTRVALFAGNNSSATVGDVSFSNAASVGAKTVNGPGALKAPTRSPFVKAATSLLKSGVSAANWTMLGSMSTVSMMWTTPFDATWSGTVTLASPIVTAPSAALVTTTSAP